jgi:hypothetical protein
MLHTHSNAARGLQGLVLQLYLRSDSAGEQAGWQAVHFIAASAAHSGSAAAVKLLITECDVPVDSLTLTDCTPAWLVARHACADSDSRDTTKHTLECLQQLLDLGADLYTTAGRGLLYAAAAGGNTAVLQFLLDKGLQLPEPGAVWLDDTVVQDTQLHAAAAHGRLKMVKFLLSKGARVNDRNGYGSTALRSCLQGPCDGARVLSLLLAAGGDIMEREPLYLALKVMYIWAISTPSITVLLTY